MSVFVINKLTDLLQCKVEALLVASEEVPARSGVELFCIRLQTWRCIDRRIDADRYKIYFLPHVSAEGLLQLLEISIQRQTASGASRKERIDDDNFSL